MNETILEVRDLVKEFPIRAGFLRRRVGAVQAVSGVSFSVRAGETLGLVGESGCGKSTTGRMITRLIDPTAGTVRFEGQDVTGASGRELHRLRARMQMVFQDPYASLNPRKTVTQIVAEPLAIHSNLSASEQADRVAWLLGKVGLSAEQANRYPHEFSGGQRQRIGIARALATNPKLVIADEPVSALDVSVQAQVINLMQDLQEEFGLSYLFVAHDLSVVRHISNRIAVMYLGHIVEMGEAETIYQSPLHPYSRALLASAPRPDPSVRRVRQAKLVGDIPSPINKPSGCPFRTRCPIAKPDCADAVPPLQFRNGRFVACAYAE